MKTNWKPDKVARLDFETMSTVDLTESSVSAYAKDPSTRIACAELRVDGKHYVWHNDGSCTEGDGILVGDAREVYARVTEGRTIVAHNAPFDSAIWDEFVGVEREWFDTVPTCRATGLPGRLDDVGKVLMDRGKDPAGKRLIDMISKVKIKAGQPQYFVGNPEVWKQFEEYNSRDLDLLDVVYAKTKNNVEPAVMTVDRVINDRGMPVHTPLLRYLSELNKYNELVSSEKFSEATGNINPRSPVQVQKWLKGQGFDLKGVNKVALLELINNPDEFYEGDDCPKALAGIVDALQYRNEMVRVGGSKINTALNLEVNGRLMDQLVYWGAHTGRWAGRGTQPQNWPGMVDAVDVYGLLNDGQMTYERIARIVAEATLKMKEDDPNAQCYVGSVINGLLRTCVRGPLSVIDFGAVEARGVAWIAGEESMLDIFRDTKRDIYWEYGEVMYGYKIKSKEDFERFVAKQIILGCGYGMSGGGFKRAFDRFLNQHIGKKMGRAISEEDAGIFVKKYRDTYKKVVQVWRDLGDAAMAAVRGANRYAGKCHFFMEGTALCCVLPSGRKLFYRDARIEDRVPGWAKLSGRDLRVPTIVFRHPRGYDWVLYGGRICENVVQALCRDLLAQALVNMESEGLRPCCHVHDEAVCETEDLERMSEIMSTPPDWAAGFPVVVEGYTGPFWTKQSARPRGRTGDWPYRSLKYLNGRKV